jgi:hypothetical protein
MQISIGSVVRPAGSKFQVTVTEINGDNATVFWITDKGAPHTKILPISVLTSEEFSLIERIRTQIEKSKEREREFRESRTFRT